MKIFIEQLSEINNYINNIVWGPVMLAFLLGSGILFTVKGKFFQLFHFRLWIKKTLLAIFKTDKVHDKKGEKSISQFQSVTTALAATLGTGNITGVGAAIAAGGPGAIFWMWVSAFFGMMTSYFENVLGIMYRHKDENNNYCGGPMIYLERGLKSRPLAVAFAAFAVLASFGIGNMGQVNKISGSVKSFFPFSEQGRIALLIGIIVMIFSALVIAGGIKRIAGVTEKAVPIMAILYFLGGFIILSMNYRYIPHALSNIVSSAFSFKSVSGGTLGYVIMYAVKFGFSRGVFSNEAGMGSSVIIHSASNVSEPSEQGMWGIFEVFADTILMCTVTALIILTTYPDISSGVISAGDVYGIAGDNLTKEAFASVFGISGELFITIMISFFAFSTVIGWSYYGESAVVYLFGKRAGKPYKMLFIGATIIGCVSGADFIWNISDTFNALMALPNLIGVILLSGKVTECTSNYLSRLRGNKNILPLLSAYNNAKTK